MLPSTVDAMAAAGSLDEHFADRLGDRAVVLPTLSARAEDLRALALYQLSRIGLRLRGEPLGLSLAAQQLLNEYNWPGNDLELESTLLKAALDTRGDVVDEHTLGRFIAQANRSGPQRMVR